MSDEPRVLTEGEIIAWEAECKEYMRGLEYGYTLAKHYSGEEMGVALATIRDREQRIGQLWEALEKQDALTSIGKFYTVDVANNSIDGVWFDLKAYEVELLGARQRIAELEAAVRNLLYSENEAKKQKSLDGLQGLVPQPEEGGDDEPRRID